MATRRITTRLALEGESEYKASIKQINSELQLHKSELSKVEAQYRESANSLAALEAKESALKGVLGDLSAKHSEHGAMLEKAQAAQQRYANQIEKSNGKLERAKAHLKELEESTEDTSQQEAKLTEEIEKHEKALATAEVQQQKAATAVNYYQRQLNGVEKDQANFSRELEKTEKYLDEAKSAADGCATSIDQYGKEVKQTEQKSEEFGKTSVTGINALASALKAAGVAAAMKAIAAAIKECTDASIGFESAIAGVFKTVEGSDAQLAAISDGIKQMSTEIPATTAEIAAVAESAGQLGIATEDVLAFSRVMLDLGESSNLSADEAATALARFANITGTAAEDYGRLGSVIVGLGNNFATTEAEITEMATRLASAGTLSGLTEAEIMALATAMSSVGIEAEAGGTAMTQTLSAMEKAVSAGGADLEAFARIAGMSASEFSTAWESDAITAIQAFISGLGRMDEQGESATLVLEELGLSGVRQGNMLKSLALASDTLTGAVGLANQAWTENTALTDEANKRYETTESKLAMAGNAFNNVKAAIGDALTPALKDLAEAGTGAFSWAADFVEQCPWLVQAITGVVAAGAVFVTGVTANAIAVKLFGDAAVKTALEVGLLKTAMTFLSAHPIIAIASAATGALVALGSFTAGLNEASAANKDLLDSLEQADNAYKDTRKGIREETDSILASVSALENLAAVEVKSTAQKQAMAELVDQMNQSVPDLTLSYDEQTDQLTDLSTGAEMTAESIREIAQAMAEQKTREADIERLSELYIEQAQITDDLAAAEKRLEDANADLNAMLEAGTYGAIGYEGQTQAVDAAISEAQRSVEELTKAQDENAASVTSLSGKYETAEEAVARLGTTVTDSADKSEVAIDSMHRISASLAELTQEYEKAKASARESIDEQVGLFQELDGKADQSVDDLLNTLSGQLHFMEDYAENIQTVMKNGLDPEVLQQLTAECTEENARYLDALAQASDGEIQLINSRYKQVQDEKDKLASAMGDAQVGLTKAMENAEKEWAKALQDLGFYNETYTAGQETVRGAIEGAQSMAGELERTYEKLGLSASNAFKHSLDIHSPSRVFALSGRYTVEGVIQGIDETEDELIRRVEALGEAAARAIPSDIPPEPNVFSQTAAQAAAVAGSLITVERAKDEDRSDDGSIHIDFTAELDGAVLAKKSYTYNKREERRRGRNLTGDE